MWVFGYGSLVWYTNFPFDKSVSGCVRGYARRFWQASPDHRGTIEKPGRTVTLIKDENSSVWGVAYHIAPEHETQVRAYLAWREKAGYETEHVPFHPNPDTNLKCFTVEVFISPAENNQYFVGPEEIEKTANIIVTSVGPSGTNIEYLLRLANNIAHLSPNAVDDYLKNLVEKVVSVCKEKKLSDPTLTEFGYLLAELDSSA